MIFPPDGIPENNTSHTKLRSPRFRNGNRHGIKTGDNHKDRRPSLSFDVSMHAADCFCPRAET
tara:strand:+ start:77022 stop:77210 length:189 start_codon:yes stop_codon:yes gene_type:complete